MAGDLREILARLDPRIDLVISGHTHKAYVCDFSKVDPSRHFTVTSAGYGGTLLTDIALTIDPRLNDVTGITATNVPVQSAGEGRPANAGFESFTPNPEIADYVAKYTPGESQHIMPAPIHADAYRAACDLGVAAHKALGCRGDTSALNGATASMCRSPSQSKMGMNWVVVIAQLSTWSSRNWCCCRKPVISRPVSPAAWRTRTWRSFS